MAVHLRKRVHANATNHINIYRVVDYSSSIQRNSKGSENPVHTESRALLLRG